MAGEQAAQAMAADFDPAALAKFLDERFGAAAMRLERIGGGQSNPTYFVDHGRRRMVLRKKPAGPILRGAHAIDREYRVLAALAPTGVPVPRPVLYHADEAVLGTPFYLMEKVEGRVFRDCALPCLPPEERRANLSGHAEALAKLHAVDPDAVGLGRLRPARAIISNGRSAAGPKQFRDSPSEPIRRWRPWPTGCRSTCRRTTAACRSPMRLPPRHPPVPPRKPEVVAILDGSCRPSAIRLPISASAA